jgi:hypothetical protein
METTKAVGQKMMKVMNKDSWVGRIIQITIGLILAFVMYIFTLLVMRTDSFYNNDISNDKKKIVMLLDGYAGSSQLALLTYNTVLPFVDNYMAITPSMNIKGGAQFTYSFWINVVDSNAPGIKNSVIFLKGDKKQYSFSETDHIAKTKVSQGPTYLSYCPMVSFGNSALEFSVQFNTVNKIAETLYVSRITSENEVFRKNLVSVLQNSWMMLTIVFEDNIPINDFENGVRVQFYLNDMLYDTGVYSGMLKQNMGNLFFFPGGAIAGVKLSTMKYFNYAISIDDIKKMYSSQPSTKPISSGSAMYSSINISDRNTLDIYNL